MALNCDKFYIYFDTPGLSGNSLVGKNIYISSSGGSIAYGDGYYSDGTYIYYVVSGVVQSANTPAYYSCGGAPATPEPATPTPIPWICVELEVNVGPQDRADSDDGYVYFDFYDCSGTHQTLSYNTNKSNFNTGYCLTTQYPYSCYILVGGNQTEPTVSSINDPFTATICAS